MKTRRARWAGFRVFTPGGDTIEIELNERGQLIERPPRAPRRRHLYCEDSDNDTRPHLRVARFLGIPESSSLCSSTISPLENLEAFEDLETCDDFETTDIVNCTQEEASPGPYAGQWNESLFDDSFSFQWDESDMYFDPIFNY
jgi:hypothetical protein